jgi:hypothetical protein
VSVAELLRNILSRIVWIREEGDPLIREQALEDLEHDLAGALGQIEQEGHGA